MSDLISREKAIATVHNMRKCCDTNNIEDFYNLMIVGLEDLTPAEKTGRWVFERLYHEADECICSECGQLMTTAHGKRMKFCPNCGAKMEGEGMIPEKEREALQRLTMCARHDCKICKYKDKYTFEDCYDEITDNMHILFEALDVVEVSE